MNGTNRKAAALSYNQNHRDVPTLSALGKGLLADDIIALAKANDIPVIEAPSLVEMLSKLNVNDTIPEELYQLVAEVFAFIYNIDQKNK